MSNKPKFTAILVSGTGICCVATCTARADETISICAVEDPDNECVGSYNLKDLKKGKFTKQVAASKEEWFPKAEKAPQDSALCLYARPHDWLDSTHEGPVFCGLPVPFNARVFLDPYLFILESYYDNEYLSLTRPLFQDCMARWRSSAALVPRPLVVDTNDQEADADALDSIDDLDAVADMLTSTLRHKSDEEDVSYSENINDDDDSHEVHSDDTNMLSDNDYDYNDDDSDPDF